MTPTFAPGLATVGFGTYLSASFLRDLFFAVKSRAWPATSGKVIEAELVQTPAARMTYNNALVGYVYEVRGVRYTSNRIDYSGRGGGFTARRYLQRHYEGGSVSVRYDPNEPERAVLETGPTFGNFLRLLVGFAVVWFGFVLLLAS